jgi:hypothetical protein
VTVLQKPAIDFASVFGSGLRFGSGSGRAKITSTHKIRKKFVKIIFGSARCSFLRAEDFSCSFLYWRPRVKLIAIFDQKMIIF